MGQMLIRNLDDGVIATLKRRAAENRTSAEEEARRALTANTGGDVQNVLARLDAIREKIGPLPGPDSTQRLRWERYTEERPDDFVT